ncbi:CMGC/CDK protein kinase [Aphelenchoides avenae]|nr:CMGC/CDK protein kinase [Aphelenchus avenae]
MCSGVPIFPGVNDVADQLDRIFSIRGLPDPEAWPDVKELPNYGSFHFAPYVELSWDRVDAQLGRIPDSGDKLLTSLLQLNPSDRISAQAAMRHAYFASFPPEIHLLKPTESVYVAFSGKKTHR